MILLDRGESMDNVFAPSTAPSVGAPEAPAPVGSFLAATGATLVGGAVVGALTWAGASFAGDARAWAAVAASFTLLGGAALLARGGGWALAAFASALCAGGGAGVEYLVTVAPDSPQLPLLASSFRAIAVSWTFGTWIWAGVAAIALAVPRRRLGSFVGAFTAKWLVVNVGLQFLLPGLAAAMLGAWVEVAAARRDRWLRSYIQDLTANLRPALVALVGLCVGLLAASGASLGLYGFEGAIDTRAVPIEGQILSSELSGLGFTIGLWLAGRASARRHRLAGPAASSAAP